MEVARRSYCKNMPQVRRRATVLEGLLVCPAHLGLATQGSHLPWFPQLVQREIEARQRLESVSSPLAWEGQPNIEAAVRRALVKHGHSPAYADIRDKYGRWPLGRREPVFVFDIRSVSVTTAVSGRFSCDDVNAKEGTAASRLF